METELIFFWFATIFYGVSAFFYILNFISKKEKFIHSATILAWLGFLIQMLSLAWYWLEGGLGLSIYSHTATSRITGTTLMGVLVFLLVQLFTKSIRPAGILIMPINFLLLFWAGISSIEIGAIPEVLVTFWFWVHVISGGFAYSFVLLASAVALLYLLKEHEVSLIQSPTPQSPETKSTQSPELEVLDNLNYRFIVLGFIMLTIMIISGSLWANQVHGR
ncbi:MAG TPA: hypothetical protein DHV62_09145, partial [Elusimicrobia bacterium]|nr:hypothetical protein [Elusimicrobiota bacterium]